MNYTVRDRTFVFKGVNFDRFSSRMVHCIAFSFDFTGDLNALKDKPMTIKEGTNYRIKITFKVNVEYLTVCDDVKVILSFCFPFEYCKIRKENSPLHLVFYFEISSFPMLLLLFCLSLHHS